MVVFVHNKAHTKVITFHEHTTVFTSHAIGLNLPSDASLPWLHQQIENKTPPQQP
jgi:hypothetical protein